MPIDIRITDAANESRENLHKAAAILLVLAGDVPVQTELFSDIERLAQPAVNGPSPDSPLVNMTFTAAEISEAEHLGKSDQASAPIIPSASEVFAQSTAVANQLSTAPVDTTAHTSEVATVSTPPAPPVVSAPAAAAPVPPPPAPPGDAAVDSAGVRWDARIHSQGKTTIADGTWRMKKGVSQETIAQVRAEQGLAPQPVAGTVPPPPPVIAPTAPAAPGVAVQESSASAVSTSVAPPTPATEGTPITTAPTGVTWLSTTMRVTKGNTAGYWDMNKIKQILTENFGVDNLGPLAGPAHQEKIDAFNLILDTIQNGRPL